MSVDPCAVGAFQVGEDQLPAVFLNLRMEAADTLVIQADAVFVLAANRDGRVQLAKNQAAFEPFKQL